MVIGVLDLPASLIVGLLWDITGPALAFSYGAVLSLAAGALLFILVPARIKT